MRLERKKELLKKYDVEWSCSDADLKRIKVIQIKDKLIIDGKRQKFVAREDYGYKITGDGKIQHFGFFTVEGKDVEVRNFVVDFGHFRKMEINKNSIKIK